MSTPDDTAERHRRLLARVAELSMTLAEDLHAKALAAESVEEAQSLALAFHRVSRSLRQTLALEARLEREARRELVEETRRAEARRHEEAAARRKYVDGVGARLIWTEAERPDVGDLFAELELWCDREALHEERFLDGPVEAVIERLKADLGLRAAAPRRPARAAPAVEDLVPLAAATVLRAGRPDLLPDDDGRGGPAPYQSSA